MLGITCVTGRRGMEECVKDALIAQKIAGTTVHIYKGNSLCIKAQLKVSYLRKIIQIVLILQMILKI